MCLPLVNGRRAQVDSSRDRSLFYQSDKRVERERFPPDLKRRLFVLVPVNTEKMQHGQDKGSVRDD